MNYVKKHTFNCVCLLVYRVVSIHDSQDCRKYIHFCVFCEQKRTSNDEIDIVALFNETCTVIQYVVCMKAYL
jgi:hypothetical protein